MHDLVEGCEGELYFLGTDDAVALVGNEEVELLLFGVDKHPLWFDDEFLIDLFVAENEGNHETHVVGGRFFYVDLHLDFVP